MDRLKDNNCIISLGLDELGRFLNGRNFKLNLSSPFVSHDWLWVWWEVFGAGYSTLIKASLYEEDLIAFAPLKKCGDTATFLGSSDICDYQDLVVLKGKEDEFSCSLIEEMRREGVCHLRLGHVRPDSVVINHLVPAAVSGGCHVEIRQEAVSLEMELPQDFEIYLGNLPKKQRHELRRKIRRLSAAGEIQFYYTGHESHSAQSYMQEFLSMFTLNRTQKAAFMTDTMTCFFNRIWEKASPKQTMRIGCLQINGEKVAMVLLFDYNNDIYLYNSAYNPEYTSLSVGLMSKVFAMREAINLGRSRWDFLKGDEHYKYQLGGHSINLYSVEIEIG